MAEARPSRSISIRESSDVLPDIYCNPCYEADGEVLEAFGFCQNCDDYLCKICFSSHHEVKQFKRHQLVDQTNMPPLKTTMKPPYVNKENCFHHQNENISSYCKSCDQLCCKICFTVDHHSCEVEKLSTIAVNIENSKQLKVLNHKMDKLKKGYSDNHEKANQNVEDIEKYYTEALNDMKKIQEEVTRLLAETEKQAELIKAEDLQKLETIISTCEILGDQIDNIKSNLTKKESHNDNEALFIAMKRAESQLKSFEDRLVKLNSDNTIHTYTFEPDNELHTLLNRLEVLGKLSFSNDNISTSQMLTTPLHVEDIDSKSSKPRCSILLPHQKLLLTDHTEKLVKLLDIKQNKVEAEHQLPHYSWDIAKVTHEEFAATCTYAKKIQFLKVTSKYISKIREISVNGDCWGIAYNDQDQTLVVTYWKPGKVEILSLTGTVIRSIEKDENGALLFEKPLYVALSRDKTMMYVSDETQNSVTLMTLSGKVKAVYTVDGLKQPDGICVNKSGIVYVVGLGSNTVHQIVPGSDKLELLLSQKDGLTQPIAITYCDVKDKIYVGQNGSTTLKVFK